MKRIERTIIFNNRHGLHMRPASEVARIACSHESEILFSLAGRHADAKSIFELLILGVSHGDLLEISVAGHDADAAMETLAGFLDACDEQEEYPNGFSSFAA